MERIINKISKISSGTYTDLDIIKIVKTERESAIRDMLQYLQLKGIQGWLAMDDNGIVNLHNLEPKSKFEGEWISGDLLFYDLPTELYSQILTDVTKPLKVTLNVFSIR